MQHLRSKLPIYSIYPSIDGEVNCNSQGRLTTFIRVAKCNLRCSYCDTLYAVDSNGIQRTVDDILAEVKSYTPKKVTITGGEPLLYRDELSHLLQALVENDFYVTVETNGTFPLMIYMDNVSWVVDYKLPSSKMHNKMTDEWFVQLSEYDWVKFVIGNREDFDFALKVQERIMSVNKDFINFAYSPVHGLFSPADLVDLLLKYGTGIETLNLQIHKLIWKENRYGEEH